MPKKMWCYNIWTHAIQVTWNAYIPSLSFSRKAGSNFYIIQEKKNVSQFAVNIIYANSPKSLKNIPEFKMSDLLEQ